MEALSLEKEPLRFILPVYISQTNTQAVRYLNMYNDRRNEKKNERVNFLQGQALVIRQIAILHKQKDVLFRLS